MKKLNIKEIPTISKIITLSVLTFLYGLMLFLIFSNYQKNINTNKKYLSETFLQKNIYLNNSQRIINSFIVFNHISYERFEDFIEIQNSFFQTNDSILLITKQYNSIVTNIDESLQLEDFSVEYQKFQNIIYEIFNEYKKEEINLKSISRLFNKELISYQNLSNLITQLKNQNNINFTSTINNIQKKSTLLSVTITISFIIFILIFVILSIYFFKDDLKLPQTITPFLKNLSKGEILNKQKIDDSNHKISKFVNDISDNYIRINTTLNSLKNKNFDIEINKISDKDIVGVSLIELRNELVESQFSIEKRHVEDKQSEWSNKGFNIFTDIMRQHSNNIYTLSDEIIKNLVKYLDASVGGLFILQDTDKQSPYLDLIASFAYDRKKYFSKKIAIGEGLVGTVALDLSTIYLDKIPDDYIEIESGLGDAPPKNLLIIPLLTDNGLLGVIEIACFKTLQKFEIEFAENLSKSIAATIESVKINARTIELLKESQKKSDELASREKILQDTMQEVNKAHEVARRNEIEMKGILTGVDQTLMRAEYTVEGIFINSNLVHRQTMGYEIEKMRGKNILEFIQEEERETFQRMWNEVASGRPYQITVKRQNKQTGVDIWLLNQYTPIKDEKGKVIKILYLAIDVTEQKIAEEKANKLLNEAQAKELELKGVLSGIDRTIMRAEYTSNGMFITSNEVHRNVLGYKIENMSGKSILDFIQEDQKTEFQKLWKEVASGRPKELTVKRLNKATNKEIWLINQYNPIINENNKVVKVLYLAIDITEQKNAEENAKKFLEESKQKQIELTGIFAGVDQAIMRAEYSPDGIFLDANDLHVQTLGYDFEKMKGQNILNFIPEEEKEYFKTIWNNVKSGSLEQITVKRKNQISQQDVWLLNQYTPIEDSSGKVMKILYLAIDISEQKMIEQMASDLLKSSQEKEMELKAIILGVDKTILRAKYNKQGIFIDSNIIHRDVLGYKVENMIGKSIFEFIPKEEFLEFEKIWSDIILGEAKRITVKRSNKITGKNVWLVNQYVPIFDKSGNVSEVLYLGIDVSEEKKLETQANELIYETKSKEFQLTEIFAGIDQTLMRAEYTPDGIFVDSNDLHQKNLGYNKYQMIGKNIMEFIPEEEKEEFNLIWEKVKAGSLEQIIVMRHNKQTQNQIWLLNQYTPIKNEKGELIKIIYFAFDISTQKRLEQELIVQEEIMTQNMEELFKEYQRIDEENQKLKETETDISESFDSEIDKKYTNWLNSFD